MTSRQYRVVLPALLATMLWSAAAWAQFGGSMVDLSAPQAAGHSAITASGTTTIRLKPGQLRLYMQVQAKGKTLEDALAKMKDRREAATAQLEAFKADKKSIVFGNPALPSTQSSQARQVEAMVVAQMQSRGKKLPKGLQAQRTVTVTATLAARWSLAGLPPEQMLVTVQGIEDKVKAADLSGGKEAEKVSAEDEELDEEAAQMANRYGQAAPDPSQPQFLFVAVVAKEEREKAMAEAFANAKSQAVELAKAAGVQLGPLVGLSGNCSGQGSLGDEYSGYDPTGRTAILRQIIAQHAGDDPDQKQNEAIGPDPNMLKFTFYATAMFQVGK
jgi:uncharacterized protein YggE